MKPKSGERHALAFLQELRRAPFQRILFIAALLLTPWSLFADGCFVFRWNKEVDINEPTQKAILVYENGREDLLLQVKYEGPLEEFGWLVPVPNLPTVTKGEMEPFYQLSQLTQRQFGGRFSGGLGGAGGAPDRVTVIEVKTVGAYEVAILSATDAGSLERWLQANGYSAPPGGAAVLQEYIRNGWYFVAAKIQLDRGVAFKLVSATSPKDQQAERQARHALQKQMAGGELHPLRISFDTPRCIFPLKISAVGGKPSEVSLYVLSAEPLANKLFVERQLQKARRAKAEEESRAPGRLANARTSMQNTRSLMIASQLYGLTPRAADGKAVPRDWSVADLEAMGEEEQPIASLVNITNLFESYYPPNFAGLAQIMEVPAETATRCAKVLDRLAGKPWRVTKQVYTFSPEEMVDLEFEPAIAMLAGLLATPEGHLAAGPLYNCGPAAVPAICAACRSTNATERINASFLLQSHQDASISELLLTLLRDPLPQVRYNGVMAIAIHSPPRFTDALFELLRDPDDRVGRQAAQWLTFDEKADNTPRYLQLLKDPDLDVAARALHVLIKLNPTAIPREQLLRFLGVPRMTVVSQSLSLLQGPPSLLSREALVSATGHPSPPEKTLSSQEAAPLTTNRLSLAKLAGLKILSENADADAVSLAIPMLRNTNSLVRTRTATVLHLITEQDFPEAQPAGWEEWWQTNRQMFKAR